MVSSFSGPTKDGLISKGTLDLFPSLAKGAKSLSRKFEFLPIIDSKQLDLFKFSDLARFIGIGTKVTT